ncbi:MAG: hypothetical protein HC814_06525 [Rhodobacteraceae bacterium]|nr:hypothetical protein [Paracoccaceae bacterium]
MIANFELERPLCRRRLWLLLRGRLLGAVCARSERSVLGGHFQLLEKRRSFDRAWSSGPAAVRKQPRTGS